MTLLCHVITRFQLYHSCHLCHSSQETQIHTKISRKLISRSNTGTVLSGVVSNRMPYGLFVDIGVETDALLHFGKLSHNHRIRQLGVSSRIHVKVERVDMRRQRISILPAKKTTVTTTKIPPWRTKNDATFASHISDYCPMPYGINSHEKALKREREEREREEKQSTKKRRRKE